MKKQSYIDLVLRDLQTLHAVVLESGEVWAPGIHVPTNLTEQVLTHRRAIRSRIAQSSIYTCPAPGLHRAHWDYRSGQWTCDVCARLLKHVS